MAMVMATMAMAMETMIKAANSEVKIKQCNGRKCNIDITKLDLDGDSISFELRGNG
jgi:hypothetical protein